MTILRKALIRCGAIGVFLTGLFIGHATMPVRAQPAAIRVNNNTMGLFIDPPTTRYHNFGTTLGTNGFGIRELAGIIQAKDDGGAWIAIAGAAGGPFLPLAGGTLTGNLAMGAGTLISFDGGTTLDGNATNILSLLNSTNAQAFLLFETITDGSNNQGLSIDAGVTAVDRITYTAFQNGSETDPVDLVFNPLGTGNVGFGTAPPVRYHDVAGVINAPSISASESYKSGLGVSIGTDTAHDIDAAAGVTQSFDTTEDIIFAAQAGKQLDVAWATGAAAGMNGDPDRTAAIVLTFSLTASPDTITAGSGTPWADCNALVTETGTVLITGGSTNNGIFEIASCTDTVLTLGDGVLTGDETGGSGEYESRLILPETWYHIYLIELAGAEDICADVSETAVNCLSESGYDQYRLLQSILTDATANIRSF